ncbi:hypothetical protein H4S08_004705 [Coemansia sp. RSA 1365]|nr:hypothetical protein H4S08_004705 [Coemansia sp. RSA 1365]
MAYLSSKRLRIQLALLIVGLIGTSAVLMFTEHNYWAIYKWPSPQQKYDSHTQPLEGLAVIFPVNNNTDMQFYRNTWLREYLYPVCDWPGPDCKIVCNRASTYKSLDKKTICFSREMKKMLDKEFFIKLDDDAFVDQDYVIQMMRKYHGAKKPVYISDHIWNRDRANPDTLNNVKYGNGKFYMFNRQLVKCLNVDMKYRYRRSEDAVFGGMVSTGCGRDHVKYIQEDDNYIWHKKYSSKNKSIDLAYIKNH